jgi:hypothetical protein
MNRKLPVVLLFLYSFYSCRNRIVPIQYDKDVQEIIIANIAESIGYGDSAKMAYRFPPLTKDDHPDYKRYYDSIKSILNTESVFITILDSFTQTQTRDIQDITFVQRDSGITSNIAELIKDISTDSVTKQELDLTNMSAVIRLPVRKGIVKQMNDIRIIAQFVFSKIAFNKDKTKAAVYQSYYCGGKCGYGELRVLVKKENKWLVVQTHRTWIS